MSKERWPVPKTWKWVEVNEIAYIVGGGTPSSKIDANFKENGIPWITPADLAGYNDAYIRRGRRDLSELGYASSSATLVPAGSVLYSTRAPIGYCVIAENEISTSQGFKTLVLKEYIQPEFIRYYLLSSKDYAESKASGTTFLELSGQRVGELIVPLAPHSEQRRVVKKIDNLISSAGRAKSELEYITPLIEKYKNKLLSDIYIGEHNNFNKLEDICLSLTDGDHQAPPRVDEGIPFITISNMSSGVIDLEQVTRFVPQKYYDELKPTRRAEEGDVLFSVTGTIGIPALVTGKVPFVFQRHIAIIKPDPKKILSEYLYYILSAPQVKEQVLEAATGSAQLTVPLSKLRQFIIPTPSLLEQEKIILSIKNTFDWLSSISSEQKAAVSLIPKLNSAIFSKAFRGELVPQDPNDDSANILLNQIKGIQNFSRIKKHRVIKNKDAILMKGKMTDVLVKAGGWLPAQEAFRLCGVIKGTQTEQIEELYAELRELDKTGRLLIEAVHDEQGRKLFDRLKLNED